MFHLGRRFSSQPPSTDPLLSYLRDNSQSFLAGLTILTGVFIGGIYFKTQAATIQILEERIKTVEMNAAKDSKVVRIQAEKDNELVRIQAAKDNELVRKDAEIAVERSSKESLQRLFDIINQAEYESAKKNIQSKELKDTLVENARKIQSSSV